MLGEKIPRGIPFWIEDKSLSFLLGFLVFMIILVPTVRLSRSGRIAIDLVFALIFLSGAVATIRRRILEGSLKRLRLDRIDVYQLHAPDPVVPFEVSLETLAHLKWRERSGWWDCLTLRRNNIERARKVVPIVSVQNRYSFADREWDYVVDYCERNGIAFIPLAPAWSRKRRGQTAGKDCKGLSSETLQGALAWLLKRSPVILPIPGTSSVAHLEENLHAGVIRIGRRRIHGVDGIAELASCRGFVNQCRKMR
jgi:aryl-alcohol dehydrogenase-like predicted oxidoreductase